MRRLVTTDDATGAVIDQWSGGEEQTLAPVAGRTHRDVPNDDTNYIGMRWTGTAFEAMRPVAPRVISKLDFARLFTQAEDVAIDASPDVDVRFLARRLRLADSVNLDHADVAAGLDVLIAKGLIASARKARILAGQPPA